MDTVIGNQSDIMVKSPRKHYLLRGKDMPEWASYSIKEASEKTGYNEEYLRRLVRQKKIEAIKVGPAYLIRAESLDSYIEEMEAADDGRAGPRLKEK